MQNNRLLIAGGVFVALLGAAIYVVKQRTVEDSGGDEAPLPELPAIDPEAVTELEISRPVEGEETERETVRLVRQGEGWRVAEPVDAVADLDAVDTALEKLEELEVRGVAATNPENHGRLEVDEAKGIRVVVKGGDATIATLWIGAYRNRSTMVRLDGEDTVVSVAGSIKFAFNKELKNWRNRRVVNVDPLRVRRVRFENEDGPWEFARSDDDTWTPAEGQAEIERFDPSKVQSVVSSIARMRAVDFAEPAITREQAGLTEPAATVTLRVRPQSAAEEEAQEESGQTEADTAEAEAAGDEAEDAAGAEAESRAEEIETIVLRLGADLENGKRYLEREGDETIYVVSSYLADRMRPNAESFQEPEPGSEPTMEAAPATPGGAVPGGPGGGQIPPELMQKIQQQLRQQASMR